MSSHDFYLLLYCFVIFLSVPFGYLFVSKKTSKTGEFLTFLLLSLVFVLIDGIISILIWTMITKSMDSFMFLGGLITGMIFTPICGFFLLLVLLLRRSTFLKRHEENNPNDDKE